MKNLRKKLRQLEGQNRLRSLGLPKGIDLSSNDYLGLKNHSALRAAAIEALENGMDIGAGGSRLLRGHQEAFVNLEEFAAHYFGTEKSLFFATGFQANQAIFQALPDRHDVIIFDEFIHASAREAIQNSHAKHIKIPHNDLNAVEEALKNSDGQMKWIAVESVYSMDGDLAPIDDLRVLAEKYNAILIVDEAHGTGVFGKNGKGLTEGLSHESMITLHTCGKALGVAGGLVCGSDEVINCLINFARGFVYSTAPMPLQALLVHKALEISAAEGWRREKLFALMKAAQKILPVQKVQSPIVPIILGNDGFAVATAQSLQAQGFDVRAIRPPTVPEGSARLRVSLNVNLDEKTLNDFSAALSPLLRQEAA